MLTKIVNEITESSTKIEAGGSLEKGYFRINGQGNLPPIVDKVMGELFPYAQPTFYPPYKGSPGYSVMTEYYRDWGVEWGEKEKDGKILGWFVNIWWGDWSTKK